MTLTHRRRASTRCEHHWCAPAGVGALPAPDALTGVLFPARRHFDPAEQKLGLVQYSTPDDVAALGNFGQALKDGGFKSLTTRPPTCPGRARRATSRPP